MVYPTISEIFHIQVLNSQQLEWINTLRKVHCDIFLKDSTFLDKQAVEFIKKFELVKGTTFMYRILDFNQTFTELISEKSKAEIEIAVFNHNHHNCFILVEKKVGGALFCAGNKNQWNFINLRTQLDIWFRTLSLPKIITIQHGTVNGSIFNSLCNFCKQNDISLQKIHRSKLFQIIKPMKQDINNQFPVMDTENSEKNHLSTLTKIRK